MEPYIIHNIEEKKFELSYDSKVAHIDYNIVHQGLNITHTYVPPALEGKGIGSRLVLHILNYAQKNDLKIIPTCPFVKQYLEKNPQFKRLL